MYEEAQAAYEKSVGLDPGHADAWFDLGHVYKELKMHDKAVTAFQKYLELSKGKDAAAEKTAKDMIEGMGGKVEKGGKKPAPKPKKK